MVKLTMMTEIDASYKLCKMGFEWWMKMGKRMEEERRGCRLRRGDSFFSLGGDVREEEKNEKDWCLVSQS